MHAAPETAEVPDEHERRRLRMNQRFPARRSFHRASGTTAFRRSLGYRMDPVVESARSAAGERVLTGRPGAPILRMTTFSFPIPRKQLEDRAHSRPVPPRDPTRSVGLRRSRVPHRARGAVHRRRRDRKSGFRDPAHPRRRLLCADPRRSTRGRPGHARARVPDQGRVPRAPGGRTPQTGCKHGRQK